jgi:hypothetical protein
MAFGIAAGYIARELLGERDLGGVPLARIVALTGLAIFAIQPIAAAIGGFVERQGNGGDTKA